MSEVKVTKLQRFNIKCGDLTLSQSEYRPKEWILYDGNCGHFVSIEIPEMRDVIAMFTEALKAVEHE